MNAKNLNLILLFFILNISSLISQDSHSENFKITIAGNYFHSGQMLGSCKAIQISNQNGKSLYYHIVTKLDIGKDLLIEFNRNPTNKILVTCFTIGNNGGIDAFTYVDVENGSFIDSHRFSYTWRDPYRNENKSQKVEIEINDLNNLKDFDIPYPSYLRKIKYTLEDETLTSNYYHSDELGFYFLIKKRGRDYRYYFDENININEKNREKSISEDFKYLASCKQHQLNFPNLYIWKGSVKVWFKDFEKPVHVFSNIADRRVKKDTYWDLNLPEDYDIEFTHIEVQPRHGSMVINKIYEGLPTEIKTPKTNIFTPDEDDLIFNLKFNTSKNVGYYTATYRFYVGEYYSELVDHQITNISNWQFIGIDQFVDFKFPEIDMNLISEVEGLAELKNPNSLTIIAYQVDHNNPIDYWTIPHTLLRRSWQMESGIIGVKKRIKLKK